MSSSSFLTTRPQSTSTIEVYEVVVDVQNPHHCIEEDAVIVEEVAYNPNDVQLILYSIGNGTVQEGDNNNTLADEFEVVVTPADNQIEVNSDIEGVQERIENSLQAARVALYQMIDMVNNSNEVDVVIEGAQQRVKNSLQAAQVALYQMIDMVNNSNEVAHALRGWMLEIRADFTHIRDLLNILDCST